MTSASAATLDACFGALADPTRRAIVDRLAAADATVSELAEPFDMSLPAVSKHLGVLEDAGIIRRVREGRTRRCQLVGGPLADAASWISGHRAFWERRLDALEEHLTNDRSER